MLRTLPNTNHAYLVIRAASIFSSTWASSLRGNILPSDMLLLYKIKTAFENISTAQKNRLQIQLKERPFLGFQRQIHSLNLNFVGAPISLHAPEHGSSTPGELVLSFKEPLKRGTVLMAAQQCECP